MTPATDTSTVAGQDITFTATLQDENGNQVDFTDAANVTFSGGTGSWGANALAGGRITSVYTTNTTVVTNETLTVTENIDPPAGNQIDTSNITTVAGAATKVCMETAADGNGDVVGDRTVVSGDALTVYAITRDTNDNFVANVAATAWSLTDKTGVVDGDLVPAGDAKSATFTGALAGTAVIHVTSDGLTAGDSGTITVTTGAPTKVRVETAADGSGNVVGAQNVVSGDTLTVYAITRDADNKFVANVAADTWSLTGKTGGVVDGDLVPEDPGTESATFTGASVGTAVIHVTSGTLTAGDSGTITVNGVANNTDVDEKKVFVLTSGDATVTGTFNNNVSGGVNVTAVGNATNSSEVNQSNPRDGLVSGDKVVSGVIVNVSGTIRSELDKNGTIHIEICYNATTLTALGIDASTLAIWKYNITTEKWVKQQPSTRSGTCVYVDVNHLCTFALVGSKATPSGSTSGGGGTYPPGWFGTPAPAVTATKAPASATATATDAPPDDKATPAPTKKPAVTKATTPVAEGTTAETAKNGAPGFTAVFAIAGMLAVAYAMMRRRE